MQRLFFSLTAVGFAGLTLTAACGSDDPGVSVIAGVTTGAAGGSSGEGGAGGDATNSSTTDGSGGGFNPSMSSGQGGMDECLADEAEATPSPLDIVVVLDRSNSMEGALWDGSVQALTSFFNDPGGTDLRASITYFPPPDDQNLCQIGSYDPPHVALTDLATPATLTSDIAAQAPQGLFTPTWAALYGGMLYANQVQDDNPDHVVIVVLASDGDPTACNTDVATIADLAAQGYAYNGVRTFVVAIQGATVANLDQIASAGQTQAALDVTGDVTLFKQKLDEIRAQVLACEYIIPEPTGGEEFDPTKVNVKYTPGGGGMTQSLPQAADQTDCGSDPGWYYDDPVLPTKIFLCPASCDTIQGDTMAKVDFAFGCPTVLK